MTLETTLNTTFNTTLEILETYDDLSISQKKYVLNRVGLKKVTSSNFNDMYVKIAQHVEDIQKPYIERSFPSIDQSIAKYGETELSHFLGTEDLIEFERDEISRQSQVEEYISDLSSRYNSISKTNWDFISELGITGKLELQTLEKLIYSLSQENSEQINNNISIFKKKIHSVDEDYLTRGNMSLISFSPLKIRYSGRKLRNSPIDFFNENKKLYSNLTRSKLKELDSGLYKSLVRNKQIQKAIPDNLIFLTNTQIKKILDSYESNQGNIYHAETDTGFCHDSIKKFWEKNNLYIPDIVGTKLRDNSDIMRKINLSYSLCDGSASKASKLTGTHINTILKYWREFKFKINKSGGGFDDETKLEIQNAFATYNGIVTHAQKALGYTNRAIKKNWEDAGFDIPKYSPKGISILSDETLEKIKLSYGGAGGIVSVAAKTTGECVKSIRKEWKKLGFEIKIAKMQFSKQEIDLMANSFNKYDGVLTHAAKSVGRSPLTVRKVWVQKGFIK